MSRLLLHRCTTRIVSSRQAVFQQLRTATRPGQQRPISQLAATAASNTADRLRSASPPLPPIDYFHATTRSRSSLPVGARLVDSRHAFEMKGLPPVGGSSSSISVRWFSSDTKDDSESKNEKKGKEDKKEHDKKEKQAPDAKAAEVGASDAKAKPDETPKDAAAKQEGEGEDDACPSWQNPLHHNNPDNQKIYKEDFGPGEVMPLVEAPPFEDPNDPDKILASQEVYDLADEIVNLSMVEMKELVTKIGDHFEFEKPPFTGSDGSGGGGDDDGGDDAGVEAAPAKTAFDLKLVSFDAKSKIKVIKEVRALAGLGLKEAKDMVEGAPKVVMKDISKEIAEELKEKLEAVGAVVEIV